MITNPTNNPTDPFRTLVDQTLNWVIDLGINGFGPLPSAIQVAKDQLAVSQTPEAAIDGIIFWRTIQAGGTGFCTGLGGIPSLPLMIPASLVTSYALGANTAAAIAHLRGYDLDRDSVRSFILLCLMGQAAEEILRNASIRLGQEVGAAVVQRISPRAIAAINQRAGFSLLAKTGERGLVNLNKLILPMFGGVVGGCFDAAYVYTCGYTAKSLFPLPTPAEGF